MPILSTDIERLVFLRYLRESMEGKAFQLHAFVLMTNHVHLLATPAEKGIMAEIMSCTSQRFAQFFNKSRDRRGPLLQDRFWSSVIEAEIHFYRTMRYIELNPVRAGMVLLPGDFPWSSFAHNTGLGVRPEITFHEQYLMLGSSWSERAAQWKAYVLQGIADDELKMLRKRFRRNHPLGCPDFERRHGLDPELGTLPGERPQGASPT